MSLDVLPSRLLKLNLPVHTDRGNQNECWYEEKSGEFPQGFEHLSSRNDWLSHRCGDTGAYSASTLTPMGIESDQRKS